MKKYLLLLAAKLLVVLLVAWFVRGTFINAWEQLQKNPIPVRYPWLVLSGLIYLVALLPAGWFWHRVLVTLGQDAGLGETLQAYYLGHLGKYVPGKAMVILLRTGLIRSHRVDTTLAVVSVFYETLSMMAVGSFLAVGILAFRLHEQKSLILASIGFMLLTTLPTLPPIFRLILKILKKAPQKKSSPLPLGEGPGVRAEPAQNNPSNIELPPGNPLTPNTTTVLLGWLAMTLVWFGMAASLWAVFRSCGLDFGLVEHFPDYTAVVCLSVVVGFLAMIPGGLFAREMVLLLLAVQLFQISESQAVVASALLRLVWLLAELVIFCILYPIRYRLRKQQSG